MKQELIRKSIHAKRAKQTAQERRRLWKTTTNISEERQQEIEKYMDNSERGCLRMSHDGADVTRQITPGQISKLMKCSDCANKPVIFIYQKKGAVGVCAKHWVSMSETVIGWTEE